MEAGRSPAGRRGGGAGISSLRPSRTRLIALLAATVALGLVALRTELGGGAVGTAGAVVAALGLPPLLIAAALRFTPAIPWAVGVTGAGYVIGRAHHATVDGWAAVVGALLLLGAELAWWAAEEDRRIHVERTVLLRRLALVAALTVATALAGVVLIGAAAVSTSAGATVSVVGVAAAVAAVAVVLRLLRGAPRRSRS